MLQIFDDGRLTDSKGRTVDFKNTIIIMTSNIGSDIILDNAVKGLLSQSEKEHTKEEVSARLRDYFKPEFLNRIDETVYFDALTLDDLKHIVDIQVQYLKKLLEARKIEIEITEDAKKKAAEIRENAKNEAAKIEKDMIAKARNRAQEALQEAREEADQKLEAEKQAADKEAGLLKEKAGELEKAAVEGVIQKLL